MRNTFFKLSIPILAMPRFVKRTVALSVDLGLCILTVWLAYYLRLGEFVSFSGVMFLPVAVSIGIAFPLFIASGLYRAIFRYSGWPALLAVARSVAMYGLFYAFIFTIIGVSGVPRTIGIIQPILLLLFVGGSRALARFWLGEQYLGILRRALRKKVLIYGAGNTGRQLVVAMSNNQHMQVVGFLDDDERLFGHFLNGQPIYSPKGLANLVSSLNISDVFLAMPNLSRKRRNQILTQIQEARVSVRTVPSVNDLIQGKVVEVSDLRELDIDDLLGREPVMPDPDLLALNIRNKVVMVTGAGGSIGSELCRQILVIGPSKLLLVEQSEFALYAIHQELDAKLADSNVLLVPLIASVQDAKRMNEIVSTWSPGTVYHAAAYKHVPLVEHNPLEGIKNNVMGTLCTAKAAIAGRVADFVLISTDKAVRPTSIMGASKRLAEMVLQALAGNNCCTKFSMVRFGNVLGSSGSVVPRFRQQIREGGPITLTHNEMTRYFMTIPEASQLVIQAGAMGEGGDVFVLNMGEPVKIIDLARRMVELSGLTFKDERNSDGEIEIQVTGLRSGEKLYEELLIGDNPESTQHPRIIRAHEKFMTWEELEGRLSDLENALSLGDVVTSRSIMQELVPEYVPNDEILDWAYMERVLDAAR